MQRDQAHRTNELLERIAVALEKKPGIVIYTILNKELREHLKLKCKELDVKCFSPIANIIAEICSYCGVLTSKKTPEKEIF